MVPLMTWGALDGNKVVRDPNFPDLPSFPEVYEKVTGKKFKGTEAKAWTVYLQQDLQHKNILCCQNLLAEQLKKLGLKWQLISLMILQQ